MVSIAMATYNGEKYINEQIESIINQTYSDIEIVITDDCSTDDTVEILKKYQKKDSRIKIYENNTNLGFVKNFEKAILLCKGEFIALSDQDDIWIKNKIEKSVKLIGSKDIVCSNALLMDENDKILQYTLKKDVLQIEYIPEEKEKQFLHLCYANFVQGSTVLGKSEFIKACMPIPDCISYHDEWIAFKAIMGNGISYIDEPLLYYRQHSNQQTHNIIKSFRDELKPSYLTKEELIKKNRERVEILQGIEKKLQLNEEYKRIIEEAIAYNKHLPKKDIFYLSYLIKNYDAMFFQRNKLHKFLIIQKKIIGSILFNIGIK